MKQSQIYKMGPQDSYLGLFSFSIMFVLVLGSYHAKYNESNVRNITYISIKEQLYIYKT